MVLVGAGISVSCGIPDFRSENGIYRLVEEMGLELDDPQCLFDREFFNDNPEPFYRFAHKLYPKGIVPSPTHHFLAHLAQKKKLLRVFTQNIDGLELAAGLPANKVIACHGTLAEAACTRCRRSVKAEAIWGAVEAGEVATCETCHGVMKPKVTFFGEPLDSKVKRALEADREKADLLLVIGTSLKVQPMSLVVGFLPPTVPQVLVNRDMVQPLASESEGFDVALLGKCDDVVHHICRQLDWNLQPRDPEAAKASKGAAEATEATGEARGPAGGPAAPSAVPTKTEPEAETEPGSARMEAAEDKGTLLPTAVGSALDPTTDPITETRVVSDDAIVHITPTEVEQRVWTFGEVQSSVAAEQEVFVEVVSCDLCEAHITGVGYSCRACFDYDL